MITNTLKDWIAEKLRTIEVLTERVYVADKDFTEFPCAVVQFNGRKRSEASTNRSTASQLEFKIRIIYDLTGDTIEKEKLDTALYDLSDTVFEMFDLLRDADGNADFLEPAVGESAWLDDKSQKRYTDITLTFDVETEAR